MGGGVVRYVCGPAAGSNIRSREVNVSATAIQRPNEHLDKDALHHGFPDSVLTRVCIKAGIKQLHGVEARSLARSSSEAKPKSSSMTASVFSSRADCYRILPR